MMVIKYWLLFLFFAWLPSGHVVFAAQGTRTQLKAPIQPDEGVAPKGKVHENQGAKSGAKATRAKPKTKPLAKVRPTSIEVPGQLSFSSFDVRGRVSQPRVDFVLDPIPLEMVDEPFVLDYQQRVRNGAEKKDLGL